LSSSRACLAIGALLAAALVLLPSPASAQFVCTTTSTDITCINSGTAAGFPNTANGLNQNATTINSGTNTGGFSATTLNGGNATATNSGTNSGGFIANTFNGGNATATNSGTHSGTFSAQTLNGGNATATNSGTNSGAFTAQTLNGGNATATNSGTNGNFFAARAFGSGNATVINSGTNSGGFEVGTAGGGNATAINSGSTSGGTVSLSVLGGGTSTLTNSGLISNFGGTAIRFVGGPDTLNVLQGSIIIGAIQLFGTNDTVNFRAGNQNLTFNTLAGATVTSTVPFVVSGNRVVTVDPTPFAMADRNLMDFTRAVSSAVPADRVFFNYQYFNNSKSTSYADESDANTRLADPFANIPGLAAYASDGVIFKNPTVQYSDGTALWGRGFAGQRVQQADDPVMHTLNQFYGGMIGGDWQARPDLRLGAFIGAGRTRSSVDYNMGSNDSDLVFGGMFGRYSFGASFVNFALQGGYSSTDSKRNINNNLAPGGLETATANYDGWYISPEATYGLHYGLGSLMGASYTLTPSLKLRYLYGSYDGYTESGTTAPLTVGTQTVSDFDQADAHAGVLAGQRVPGRHLWRCAGRAACRQHDG
jgi:hypothetical protein